MWGCGNKLILDIDDNNNVISDIAVQRLDISLPHQFNNIIPMCIYCNYYNKWLCLYKYKNNRRNIQKDNMKISPL